MREKTYGEVASVEEIATLLGITKQRLNVLQHDARQGFPLPALYLKATPIWDVSEIEAWAMEKGRGRLDYKAYDAMLAANRVAKLSKKTAPPKKARARQPR